MNVKETKFFELLRYSVGGNPLPDGFCCNEEEIKYFYELALKHDIASIVAYALEKNGLYLQDEYSLKFQDEMLFAAGRVTLLDCFYNEVTAVLVKEKIDYVSLKGSVIRKLYSQDYFRTSSDIDILVKKRDFERACSALKAKLKLKEVGRSQHDQSLSRSPFETVEVHFSLVDEDSDTGVNALLDRAWDNAYICSGYEYSFTGEFFMFYQIAHILKHFESYGCGIRFFIDLYFLRNFEFDKQKFNAMIEENGLTKFYNACQKLVDCWFCGEKSDTLIEKMQDYIVRAGIYGNYENKAATGNNKSGGKLKYILSRLFLSYDELKGYCYYPRLEGKRWLTPYYQVKRWFSILFCGRFKSNVKKLKKIGGGDEDTAKNIASLFKELGIE